MYPHGDPREDVGEDVGVGVVERGLYSAFTAAPQIRLIGIGQTDVAAAKTKWLSFSAGDSVGT